MLHPRLFSDYPKKIALSLPPCIGAQRSENSSPNARVHDVSLAKTGGCCRAH